MGQPILPRWAKFLASLEDSVTLTVLRLDFCEVKWSGKLQYPAGDGNVFVFSTTTDDIQIDDIINQLEAELVQLRNSNLNSIENKTL